MSEVDLILAALIAGAAAGITAGASTATQAAVLNAYTGLRDLLRRAFTRNGGSANILETAEAEPGTWQTELGSVVVTPNALNLATSS